MSERQNEIAQNLIQIHRALDNVISSPHVHDVVEVALATAISARISKESGSPPIWLMVIANPSSGKTEAVLALRDPKDGHNHAYLLDSFTENSFMSGYVDAQGNGVKKQLLHELDGKVLIIKDMTTMFSMHDQKIRKVLGELQSIYDGSFSKATGTVGVLEADSVFSILACITPMAIQRHQVYMSTIGSRFLMIRLEALSDEEQDTGMKKIWADNSRNTALAMLRALMTKHFKALFVEPMGIVCGTPEQQDEISRMAQLLARGRGVVLTKRVSRLDEQTGSERSYYETIDTQVEEPFRALQQLRTLAQCLAHVHGRTRITDHEMELLRRVVLSSVDPARLAVLRLFPQHTKGITANELKAAGGRGFQTAVNALRELTDLKILQVYKDGGGSRYRPVPEFYSLLTYPRVALDHVANLQAVEHATDVPSEESFQETPSRHYLSTGTDDQWEALGGL